MVNLLTQSWFKGAFKLSRCSKLNSQRPHFLKEEILPDVVVVQPQHSQAFKLSDERRDFLQMVVVQQQLAHGAVRTNKRGSVRAAITQAVVGQLQGLQARPQVVEGEGGDVTDVVVSQG